MTAILPPIVTKNNSNSSINENNSFLEQKTASISAAVTNVSEQLAQITKWSNDIKDILIVLINTQSEIKSSASSAKNERIDLKNILTNIKKDIIASLSSFDNKINKINSIVESVKDISEIDQTEIENSLLNTLEFISKQLIIIGTDITITRDAVKKPSSDIGELIFPVLENIEKQIQNCANIVSPFENSIKAFNSNILNLTKRINEIEKYIYNDGCWYGRNVNNGDFDIESNIGWLMTADQDKFGKPTVISNGFGKSYAIRHIFVTSANMANKIYKIRFYFSKTDSFADASILSESMYIKVGNLLSSIPIVVSSPVIDKNSKLWCAINCEAPAATLSLLLNI